MKQFNCGDVVPGCSVTFRFETEDRILEAVGQHARKDHGLTDIPPQLIEQVKDRIKPAA
jgi:predicted small metal-binding protein